MQIFIDSADIKEIEEAMSYGVDGVTTNPSLLAKSSNNMFDTVRAIARLIPGPVSVEVSAVKYEEMLVQGDKILDIADNVVLKLECVGRLVCTYTCVDCD